MIPCLLSTSISSAHRWQNDKENTILEKRISDILLSLLERLI